MDSALIPEGVKRCSFGKFYGWLGIVGAVLLWGVVAMLLCWFKGLNQTNMNDYYGFALWIWADLAIIALGGGAFFTGFLRYIVGKDKLKNIINYAVLIGFICYSSALLILAIDIGQPLRGWFIFWHANVHSMLTEVAFCLSCYFVVLTIEYLPLILENRKLDKMPFFHNLSHNHDLKTGKPIYRYPLIQFKLIENTPAIIAVTERAVEIFSEIFMTLERIVIDNEELIVFEKDLNIEDVEFGFTREKILYEILTPWIGLNRKNYKRYMKAAKSWLEVLERMYLTFSVRPYAKSLPRAVLKPPKVYFFDNGDVIGDKGARFENLVAASLLKRIHFWEDRDGYRCSLRHIRDKDGREVDFVIVRDDVVEELIEVKFAEKTVSRHLEYYANRLNPKRATQIVAELEHPYEARGVTVTNPVAYFNDFFE